MYLTDAAAQLSSLEQEAAICLGHREPGQQRPKRSSIYLAEAAVISLSVKQ